MGDRERVHIISNFYFYFYFYLWKPVLNVHSLCVCCEIFVSAFRQNRIFSLDAYSISICDIGSQFNWISLSVLLKPLQATCVRVFFLKLLSVPLLIQLFSQSNLRECRWNFTGAMAAGTAVESQALTWPPFTNPA